MENPPKFSPWRDRIPLGKRDRFAARNHWIGNGLSIARNRIRRPSRRSLLRQFPIRTILPIRCKPCLFTRTFRTKKCRQDTSSFTVAGTTRKAANLCSRTHTWSPRRFAAGLRCIPVIDFDPHSIPLPRSPTRYTGAYIDRQSRRARSSFRYSLQRPSHEQL